MHLFVRMDRPQGRSSEGPLRGRGWCLGLGVGCQGDGRFFEEAAEGRIPLQVAPADPEVREKLAAFTDRYGYEFAELPPER